MSGDSAKSSPTTWSWKGGSYSTQIGFDGSGFFQGPKVSFQPTVVDHMAKNTSTNSTEDRMLARLITGPITMSSGGYRHSTTPELNALSNLTRKGLAVWSHAGHGIDARYEITPSGVDYFKRQTKRLADKGWG